MGPVPFLYTTGLDQRETLQETLPGGFFYAMKWLECVAFQGMQGVVEGLYGFIEKLTY